MRRAFLIWSFRNRQWWRPNEQGYTLNLSEAGRYDQERAARIQLQGLPGSCIAVDLTLVEVGHFNGLDADEIESKLDELRRI